MSVLSDRQLRVLYPAARHIGPASVDLTIGDSLKVWPKRVTRDPRIDQSDIWDVVEEVAYKTVVHLVENTTLLTTYLMRGEVVFPCTEPTYLERLINEVPLKAPLSFLPDMHRRIAAAIYFLALKVKRDNFTLFSHAASGFIPDWEKRYEGTLFEGMQDSD